MHRLFPVVALCSLVVTLITAVPIAAQEVTPEATFEIVAPAECQVAPRPPETLYELTGTPAAGGIPPAGQRAEQGPLPPGDPVDAETLAGITATARELAACRNAGESLRALGLYSDDYIRRVIVAGGVFSEEYANFLATPESVDEDDYLAAPVLSEARFLEDGRVGAVVDFFPNREVDERNPVPFFIFAKSGERWLIDEVLELED